MTVQARFPLGEFVRVNTEQKKKLERFLLVGDEQIGLVENGL